MAFERYLRLHDIPFVSVEEARRQVRGSPGIKLFDYLVYPACGTNYLVDVKGRKFCAGARSRKRTWEAWVTRGDLVGLERWESVFGGGFEGAFVFAYWLVGGTTAGADCSLAGRSYVFQRVRLRDYKAAQRQRSPKWQTVSLSRDDFVRLAATPHRAWAAAPRAAQASPAVR